MIIFKCIVNYFIVNKELLYLQFLLKFFRSVNTRLEKVAKELEEEVKLLYIFINIFVYKKF